LKLKDGPIQFINKESIFTEKVFYYSDYDMFNSASRKQLQAVRSDFEHDSSDPRLYIYEVYGIGYSKTWVHSSLKQYIEARPWLLAMLSLSILKPSYYRETVVHIPGGVCPHHLVDEKEQDFYISNLLKDHVYLGSGHLVALKENDTYFEAIKRIDNEVVLQEIPFLNGNYFISISLIVSVAIALYSVMMLLIIFTKTVKEIILNHHKRIVELRRFALTKKSNTTDFDVDQSQIKNKVLILNLFNAQTRKRKPGELIEDEDVISDEDTADTTTMSFFKSVELYINWFIRSRTNSFFVFLCNIYPTNQGFNQIDSHENIKDSYIPYETLEEKYKEF
jgi:hypothetical protein